MQKVQYLLSSVVSKSGGTFGKKKKKWSLHCPSGSLYLFVCVCVCVPPSVAWSNAQNFLPIGPLEESCYVGPINLKLMQRQFHTGKFLWWVEMWSWSHRLHATVAFSLDLAPSVSSQLTLKECPLPQPRTTVPDEGNMNTSYEITLVPSIQFQCYISPDSFEAGEVFCCETWPEITLMPSRVKNSIRAMSMSFVPLGWGGGRTLTV